ncbi:DUF3857 domain-containing protein [Hymenobacter sp. IS2118]|uniref:DUF3857 domain-containing protein n=1 Tax=Hymenobacter sp. IS2118 TaxID=1505605 RepID=UPI000552050D|nr:DUF3857 domain-containing protein [Hymenobacter sp. IS2118]
MKLPLRYPSLLAAILLSALAAQAQTEPIKFGKPDPKDLTAAPFVGDSAAAAVVLCDFGTTSFQYVNNSFKLVSERTTRIKILKKAGYDVATVTVPLFHRNGGDEKLSSLRGFTYNLVDGKVVKSKLETANTFVEERDKNWRVRKFTLPDVREGSVIEHGYTVISDFTFNLQDWSFQREIPTRWSEFRATIPEYFDYKMVLQGYQPLAVQQKTDNLAQFTITSGGGYSGGGFEVKREAGSSETITAHVNSYQWVMKDVPAFRDEPYMTTSDDYVARLNFQLAGERFPGEAYRNIAGTWDKINTELLIDDDFGAQLGRGSFLKDQLQGIPAKYPDLSARAAAVRQVVMAAVRYDGTNRYRTNGSFRKALDAHRGTAADVNLLLIAALRTAGVPAHPLLLSTRSHGRVNQQLPLLDRFNYVVALVPLAEGQDLLVDATEPLLPCGVLPERCLNQTGRLIMSKPEDARWVNLAPTQRFVHYQQVSMALDTQGGLTGKVHEEHGGYSGVDARQELSQLGEKKYFAQLGSQHTGWTLPKIAVVDRDAVDKPLTVNYEFAQPADDNTTAGTIYLSPLRDFASEQNPFRHDDRQFPVDFGALQDVTTMITLTLPAGYELAETPKPAVVDLPDGGGRYLYSVAAVTPGVVQLTSRLSLRKTMYVAEEYANLREFYRLMLQKQGEKLVIKKKA